MKIPKQSTMLKFAAILTASPRYMGAFGLAVGANLHLTYSWLIPLEVASGLAMAILEGVAISYIFAKWRLLPKLTLDWYILTLFGSLLLLLVPPITAPYLLAMQASTSIIEVFAGYYSLRVAWSLLIASVPVLIIAGVGYADIDPAAQQIAQLDQAKRVKVAKLNDKQEQANPFSCACGKNFASYQALNGHQAKCPLKANIKVAA